MEKCWLAVAIDFWEDTYWKATQVRKRQKRCILETITWSVTGWPTPPIHPGNVPSHQSELSPFGPRLWCALPSGSAHVVDSARPVRYDSIKYHLPRCLPILDTEELYLYLYSYLHSYLNTLFLLSLWLPLYWSRLSFGIMWSGQRLYLAFTFNRFFWEGWGDSLYSLIAVSIVRSC